MKTTQILSLALASASAVSAVPMLKRQSNGTDDATWISLRSKIKHVVYLMMENHSFDNIAGYWDFNPDIDNVIHSDGFCNPYTNPNWTIYGQPIDVCTGPYETEVPLVDPDHAFAGTSYEIYRKWQPGKNDTPTMEGFIERQSERYSETPGDASFVIKQYTEAKSNILATLGKNFAFWDTYHAEHPGPTNPNRQFATSGSTCGMVDNTYQTSEVTNEPNGTTCAKSVFQVLSEHNISWKNYRESTISDAYMYKWVQDNAVDQIQTADNFYSDVANGTLPTFSYYNPECCTVDSMHPTSPMAGGEQLIKHMYDSLRGSEYWDSVLFIVNFDEHGGFWDHVPPPVDIPAPEDGNDFAGLSDSVNVTYDFTRLGVRVPAFVISPYIAPNTLIHNEGTSYADNSAYTHTSFLHFLQNLWQLDGFNNRVQWAKTFEYIFTDTQQDAIEKLPTPVWYGGSGEPEPAVYVPLNTE